MEIIGYIASIAIGISLGLIGGGGSILAVPIVVYLFGIDAKIATSYSLFIVGISAAIGAYKHAILGNLKLKSAIIFTIPSLISIIAVRKFLMPNIPEVIYSSSSYTLTKDNLVMVLFSILMILASFSMIKKNKRVTASDVEPNTVQLILIGLLVGLVTGFLGAGGGFLIIPALLFFAHMPMKQAVGTSLLIIAINSLLGFLSDVHSGVNIDFTLLLSITGFAIIGIFIGTLFSKKIDGAKLKPSFGWFVLLMGIYIITKETLLK